MLQSDQRWGRAARPATSGPSGAVEREVRLAALRAGWWLGWLSVGAVLAGLALDMPARHKPVLLLLTALAAAGNAAAMAIPWHRWLTASRGQALLDLWSVGLLAFVTALVAVAGGAANLDLLLFLVVPFLAVVHRGVRRRMWLAAAGASFVAVMAVAPTSLSTGEVAMRGALLVAATLLTSVLSRMIERQAAARASAAARAELEHALLAESHHRIKNSLQTVADLLLLGRPAGLDAVAFDKTAERIRSIAAVHELLADERGGPIPADALLGAVSSAAAPGRLDDAAPACVDAAPLQLDPACAQRLAIVVNELVANATRHGRPPIEIRLHGPDPTVLTVSDRGTGPSGAVPGMGLRLVRQVVEQALDGTFTLNREPGGVTLARVTFPTPRDAHPDR